ncbi:MAG: hypothetical protein KatS3mg110_3260 [Pirellulaceae bacterium]|nr:MAG: hypothetical protein KatS3mg110_3260 [Pirellulaceae bacterium]
MRKPCDPAASGLFVVAEHASRSRQRTAQVFRHSKWKERGELWRLLRGGRLGRLMQNFSFGSPTAAAGAAAWRLPLRLLIHPIVAEHASRSRQRTAQVFRHSKWKERGELWRLLRGGRLWRLMRNFSFGSLTAAAGAAAWRLPLRAKLKIVLHRFEPSTWVTHTAGTAVPHTACHTQRATTQRMGTPSASATR